MAREHARILCRIWSDEDFRQRSPEAQRMYFLLLSQRGLNHAGVLPLTVQRWANCSPGTTPEDVLVALEELVAHGYVVFDPATDELLVRSFLRNDGVVKQPNVFKSALRHAREVESLEIRAALAVELRRLSNVDADRAAVDLDPNPSGTPSEGFAKGSHETRGKGEGDSSGEVTSVVGLVSSATAGPPREDVSALCDRLRERVVANGAKAVISKQWRDEARRLLDIDKRDLNQALRLIDWATGHHFWRSNILSMPTFRRQYDKLLLQARSEQEKAKGSTATRVAAVRSLYRPEHPELEGGAA